MDHMYRSDEEYIGDFYTTGRTCKLIPLRYHLRKTIKLKNYKKHAQPQGQDQPRRTGLNCILDNCLFGQHIGYTANNNHQGTDIERRRHLNVIQPIFPFTTDYISACPPSKGHK